jgi:hypothetical protein
MLVRFLTGSQWTCPVSDFLVAILIRIWCAAEFYSFGRPCQHPALNTFFVLLNTHSKCSLTRMAIMLNNYGQF